MKKRIIISITILVLIIVSVISYMKWNESKNPIMKNKSTSVVKRVKTFNSISPGVYILNYSGKDYNSTASMFDSVGYDVMEGNFDEFKNIKIKNNILIVCEKEASKLNNKQKDELIKIVQGGQNVIFTGKIDFLDKYGIEIKDNILNVKGYIWKNSKKDLEVKIENAIEANTFAFKSQYNILAYSSGITKEPITIKGKVGNGNVIYSNIALAPEKGSGYEYYPFIMQTIVNVFKIKPTIARYDGSVYIDLGFHSGETPSGMAEKIKEWGFDKVNLGAWYPLEKNKEYIDEFIYECHKRGIYVFAWFEYPMVGTEFWDQHPEWREITANGSEAHIDWRYLMALEDPKCFEAVKKNTEKIMMTFDFDGIDIAEIYFESPGAGFSSAKNFTPMHPSFRKSFETQYGFDPKEIFSVVSKHYWKVDKKAFGDLVNYRVEMVTKLHEDMFKVCEEIKKKKPYLRTDVTVIDSICDTRMKENIGVDAAKLTKLQKKYNFTLQIEDPYTLWTLGPERYKVIGEGYRKIMDPQNKLAIDINIIDRYGSVYPTKKQRGIELYQLVNNAGKYTDKVILYSLYTMETYDMNLMPYAEGYGVNIQPQSNGSNKVSSKKKFKYMVDTRDKQFFLDNKEWNIYDNDGVIIPSGEHNIYYKTKKYTDNSIHIEDINCDIKSYSINDKALNLNYESHGRCFIVLSKKPISIKLDNKKNNPKIINYNNKFTIILPQGKHKLIIK